MEKVAKLVLEGVLVDGGGVRLVGKGGEFVVEVL